MSFAAHTVFASRGNDIMSPSTLRFGTKDDLEASLIDGGFEIQAVYGNWDHSPAAATSP